MIKQLKFVGVPTRDQDAALSFWTTKMGFQVMTDQPMGKQRWIELAIPGAQTGIVLSRPTATRIASAASSTAPSPATTSTIATGN